MSKEMESGNSTDFNDSRVRVWMPGFLAHFRTMGNVTKAAEAVGIDRSTAYYARQNDPEFAKEWEDAEQQAADTLEAEAWRRAVEGYERPIFQGGAEVGRVQEYSDTLMALLLKAHKKDKYREGREIMGKDGGPIELSQASDADLLKIIKEEGEQEK